MSLFNVAVFFRPGRDVHGSFFSENESVLNAVERKLSCHTDAELEQLHAGARHFIDLVEQTHRGRLMDPDPPAAWHTLDTGGGCTALEAVDRDAKWCVWLTDEHGGNAPDDDTTPVLLGLYPYPQHIDEGCGKQLMVPTLALAKQVFELLRILSDNGGATLCWQIPDELQPALTLAEDNELVHRYHDNPDLVVHPFAVSDGPGAYEMNIEAYLLRRVDR